MRPLIYFLFLLSGATGLVYEVVWTRLLSQVFGNTVFAVSAVLAVFMAGLGSGAYLLGKWLDRRSDHLRMYGLFEIAIGLGALYVLLLVRATDPLLSAVFARLENHFIAGALVRIFAAVVFLFPPTFLMGGTLPALSKFFSRREDSIGGDVGWLYALNTAGAMLGAFAAGYALLAAFGIRATNIGTALLNLLIGAIATGAAQRQPSAAPPPQDAARASASATAAISESRVRLVLLAYALSGFAALAVEVVWSRVLVFFLGNSTYAFSALLTTFLGGSALGSFLGARFADRVNQPFKLFAYIELALAVLITATLPLLWQGFTSKFYREIFTDPAMSWTVYLLMKFLSAALVVAAPAFLFGAVFPLVCRLAIAHLSRVGRGVGTVYFFNTAGAIFGSLMAGFVLIPLIGLQGSLAAIAMLNGAAALLLITGAPVPSARDRNIIGFAVLIVAAVLIAMLPFRLHLTAADRAMVQTERELYYHEDHTATVRVYDKAADRFVSVDGHFIGATAHESDKKQKLLAHLPLLLRPDATSAITIGLGSGITLGAMAKHQNLAHIEAIEIVPGMLKAARYFDYANDGVLDNPRATVRIGDGIHYLKTTSRKFDLIVSDAKLNPEFVGNALVYTKEYYAWSRDKLTADGIFCQWIPLYLPESTLKMVFRTLCAAFPVVDLWFFPQQHFIVMGRKQNSPFDLQQMAAGVQRSVRADLEKFHLTSPYALASSHVAGRDELLRFAGDGPVNTYNHTFLEFQAVRAFKQAPRAEVESRNLRRLLALAGAEVKGFTNAAADSMQTFRESFRIVLRGLMQAKNADLLSAGEAQFRQALAHAPGDGRAVDLLQQANRERSGLLAQSSSIDAAAAALKLARFAYEQGRYADALVQVRAAVQSQPSAGAFNLTGLILQKQGKVEEAIQAFRQAYRRNANDVDIVLNLATALEQAGQFDQALSYFKEAAALQPEDPDLHNNLGVAYARQGKPALALQEYRRALQLDPQMADAYNNMGIALGMQRDFPAAIRAFEKATSLDPAHFDALKNLGNTYLQIEKFDQAAYAYEKALQLSEQDAELWLNLGMAHVRMGYPQKARACWERALALNPALTEARKNLQVLRRMGY